MARVGPQRHRKNAGKLIHALTKLTDLMGCYGVCFGVYAGLPAFRSNLLTCVQVRRIRRWGERSIQDGFLRRSGRISASLFKHPTLKVQAERLNETSVYVYPATHCHIPADSNRIFYLGNPFVFV